MNTEAIHEEKPRVRAAVIAKRYDVTERCVFNWKDEGKIPFIQIGKTIRFDLDAVVAKLEGDAAGARGGK